VQPGLVVDALEVDVQHALLEGVVLHVAQQDLVGLAGHLHVEHAGVERLLLEGMPQRVVVELDHLGLGRTTIHDAGRLARIAQTAARTRTLLGALKSDEVHD